MGWLRFLALAVLGALMNVAHSARAQELSRAEVHIVGQRSEAQRFQEVLEPLMQQQGVVAHFTFSPEISLKEVLRPPAHAAGLVARIFIDLREPEAVAIYLSNARAQSFAFRELPVEDGKSELAREATGAIVDAAVRVLMAGGSLELSRERAEQTLQGGTDIPVPSPRSGADRDGRPVPPRAGRLRVLRPLAFYSASALGPKVKSISHGPGLGLEVLPDSRVRPAFSLQYQLPVTFEGPTLGARIWALAARAGAAVSLRGSAAARLSLSLSAGLDAVWLSPRVIDTGRATADGARLIAAGILRPSLDFQHQLPGFWLGAAAFMDFDVLGTRYTVRRGNARAVVFEPWRARPGLAASVTW